MAFPAPLSRKLRDKLGSDAGEKLVSWLDEMRAEHQSVLDRIDARFLESENRMNERIHALEIRLTGRISDVKSDLMKWSFVFWCGAVAAIAALAGVLKG